MTGRPHRDGAALWEVVLTSIAEQIGAGALTAGSKVGTVAEIARAHDVSRATAQRAMNALRKRGYVVSRPGEGYYVARIQDL